ncbi:hypothetical protein RclHR1_03020005 [Rhizophagus clarus]|uniref:Uncharacterized protein n=1 Tax=Rhizophagus clarus TaxID=94130 RepID=A0A2Z6R5E3_9GLOM|nr:hypothetical protein RclHR1_03020005 [Rhizophagus clarus]GES99262.1 hypothetical protein RCL_jg9374.t1 [Rhizophagus clarus]
MTTTISPEKNPILLEEEMDHFFKCIVIEEGKWLMQNGHVTEVKPFQVLMIDAYKNNFNFGTDKLNDYYSSCKTSLARVQYVDNLKDYFDRFVKNQKIYTSLDGQFTRYRMTINDYCSYLASRNPISNNSTSLRNNNSDTLLKFKIFNIMQKAGIPNGDIDDIHKNLDLIEKFIVDIDSKKI